ncbi:MAG: alpha/beta hydrolase, partial [Bacteroidales bacterium]
MKNLRKYGQPPYSIVLIHGGPGAAGELYPVAKELSTSAGIIEPFQKGLTIDDLIHELDAAVTGYADLPVILIGHSWGAWLACLFTAQYGFMVDRLVLIASPPFEYKYEYDVMQTRMRRLDSKEKKQVRALISRLDKPGGMDKNDTFRKLGTILRKADSYDPISMEEMKTEYDYTIHKSIWKEASMLRGSGYMLESCRKIKCPVLAIHGTYD